MELNPPSSKKTGEFEAFRNFIEKEIPGEVPAHGRRVIAVTQGLGLESPPRKEEPIQVKAEVTPESVAPPKPKLPAFDFETLDKPIRPNRTFTKTNDTTLASVIEAPAQIDKMTEDRTYVATPPPLPDISPLRRALAVVMDEMFVLTLFAVGLVAMSNFLTGFEAGFSTKVFKSFSNPLFARFAMLQYAVLWTGYFAIGTGLFNATFGMWVWGIRVSFGPQDEAYPLRKLMRIFWSVIFFAPIAPLFLLIFRRKGKNLLDTLSGSNLYMAS